MIKNIINKIKLWFEKTPDLVTAEHLFPPRVDKIKCIDYSLTDMCKNHKYSDNCKVHINEDEFDFTKDTILIIDDNEGMISFLKDDLDNIFNLKCCESIKNTNLLAVAGKDAAFNLKKILEYSPNLHIKYAIIDITYGGTYFTDTGIIKYTGVDVFEMLYKIDKDFKFIFYTGNNLNPYIKSNKKLIEQFYKLTGKDIKDFVLFKTSLDMDKRREYIKTKLFKKDNNE